MSYSRVRFILPTLFQPKKLNDSLFQLMLMTSSPAPANKVRFLSVSAPHASSWFAVVPSVGLGLHLDQLSSKLQ